jgi:Cdc6-like AAA superfamily ATPase
MVLNNSEQTLLKEFVDRDAEVTRFTSLLKDERKSVMLITGDEGIGKSSVTVKLIAACTDLAADTVVSRAKWTENDNVTYLTIMRQIRDDLGDEFFQPFNDLVNFYSVPNYKLTVLVENRGSITVAPNLTVAEGASVDKIVGINIADNKFELKDSNFNTASEQRARLSDLFFLGLKQALEKKSLLIFIDQIDDMVEETRKWIWHGLVRQVQDAPLKNVRLVLCVDKEPELDDFVRRILLPVVKLPPLDLTHVVEYLKLRGLSFDNYDQTAKLIVGMTKGNPRAIEQALLLYESQS